MIGLYEITDRFGRCLYFITARGEREALQQARAEGYATATGATWIREA